MITGTRVMRQLAKAQEIYDERQHPEYWEDDLEVDEEDLDPDEDEEDDVKELIF